jgi:hypothetical protein
MAHRLVQVSFRWIATKPDADKIAVEINKVCDDWLRLNVHGWFLWTSKTPTEVYNGLRTAITNEDSVVISLVDHNTLARGWAPTFIWDWLNKKMNDAQLGL